MPTQSPTRVPTGRLDVDELVADYDEERPARHLSPRVDRFVGIWCFAVALFVMSRNL